MTITNRSIRSVVLPARSLPDVRLSLMWLYLIRGLVALGWALVFAVSHGVLGTLAIALLALYPMIDAAASIIDYCAMPPATERRIAMFNAVLSTFAAIAVGVAGFFGVAAVLGVFGAWATVAGAAQFALGLRRRGAEFGRQWPILIAGGLSLLVGLVYCVQAAGDKPTLDVLSTYATGGGSFFIVQAGLLYWRSRRQSRRAS